MNRYPPQTDDIEKLARCFDQVDTTQLAELEEAPGVPDRELVNISLRLPKHDVEVLKRVSAREGLAPSTFMRWVLHRFVRSLSSSQR